MSSIKPLYDKVLIRREEGEEITSGGIIVPGTAQEKTQAGFVIAKGEGKLLNDGQVRPLHVKEGDKVLFGKYSGTEVKMDGQDYLIIREEEILGILS